MPVKHLDITILAKVVDNFGDIGVTWRLARNLNYCAKRNSENYSLNIRLITDNLVSFNKINSKINPLLPFQECEEIKIYDWGNYEFCYNSFTKNTPDLILECFQCGNPDWLEKILFEDRVEDHPVNIIMIDYLSAEPWVSDFHCLKSLTRTASVPKVNFMPGFAKKTGGLLINEQWTMNNGQYKNGIIKNLNQRSNEKT
ncbi:MAG: elongation factor P maturation arginine rhamnosyltransferase EarP, partial [Treponema sp.]|nr:elongation factor P maturation arginine rhamnosyltransferase EarP [Treponema sp.]